MKWGTIVHRMVSVKLEAHLDGEGPSEDGRR
jgi:hypothetical protein